jgi:hypothetical protein
MITLAVDRLAARLAADVSAAKNHEHNGDAGRAEVRGPPTRRSPSSPATPPTQAAHSPATPQA